MHGRRRLLITGASGFIGRHLVPALVGRGHHVVAAVRRPLTLGPSVDHVLIKDLQMVSIGCRCFKASTW